MKVYHTYDVVKHSALKSGKCSVCGKWIKRSKTFEATVNPYNQNASGRIKTHEEVHQDLIQRAHVWLASPIKCALCEWGTKEE